MHKFLVCSLALLALCGLGSCSSQSEAKLARKASAVSQTTFQAKPSAATSALSSNLAPLHFSGSALIIQHGKIAGRYTNGWADAQAHTPNSLKMTYGIDSVQKAMTAGLLMQQVSAGKLQLTDKLSQFYPHMTGSRQITLRQMLDMTSGLQLKKSYQPAAYRGDAATVAHAMQATEFLPKQKGKWNYQPVNYVILVGVLEKVAHQSYAQLYTKAYVDKLKLKHTYFGYALGGAPHATGYFWKRQDRDAYQHPQVLTKEEMHAELGTGQIFTTAQDLYRLDAAIADGQLLGKQAAQQLHQPGSTSDYGGGFYNRKSMMANGFGYGYETFIRLSHNGQNAVILLSNVNPPNHKLEQAANALAKRFVEK